MSLETHNYSDRHSSTMKKSRRAIREELELPSYLEENNYESSPARKQRSYFWEDFGFNLMNYVLVPLSIVALFCLFVYAEVNKVTGY